MTEAILWIAYLAAFGVTLVSALIIGRRFWWISFAAAAASTVAIAIFPTFSGGDVADPWFGVGLVINFAMAWCFAAAAIYVVNVIRA